MTDWSDMTFDEVFDAVVAALRDGPGLRPPTHAAWPAPICRLTISAETFALFSAGLLPEPAPGFVIEVVEESYGPQGAKRRRQW